MENRQTQNRAQHNYEVLETYLTRPQNWWMYTLIVLVVALILAWSSGSIQFKGIATKGADVAKGIG